MLPHNWLKWCIQVGGGVRGTCLFKSAPTDLHRSQFSHDPQKPPGGIPPSSGSYLWSPCWCFPVSWPLPALFSDSVSFGAGRAGEETETEEQAGAGHRHNGPEQLRTILLCPHSFFPSVPLSLAFAPRQQTELRPRQHELQTDRSSKLEAGIWGVDKDGRACVRLHVFVCSPTRRGGTRARQRTFSRRASEVTAFDYLGVCGLLDFDFRSFVVCKEQMLWQDLTSRAEWTNPSAAFGRGSEGHVTRAEATVRTMFCFFV